MDNQELHSSFIQLTQKEKPDDRYLANQVVGLEFAGQKITLVFVLEILDRWHHAREIGLAIPQMFVHFFNQSSHQSILTRFEDALKNINTYLTNTAGKMETPISCVVSLHANKEVYFATTGDIKILLWRGHKITNVADHKDGVNQFNAVTSGEIGNGEWIFYANNNLASVIKGLTAEADTEVDPSELETLVRKHAALVDRQILTGCATYYGPAPITDKTIFLDEIESRLPLPHLKINFSGFSAGALNVAATLGKKITNLFMVLRPMFAGLWGKVKSYQPSTTRQAPQPVVTENVSVQVEEPELVEQEKPPAQTDNDTGKTGAWRRIRPTSLIGPAILVVLAIITGITVNRALKAHQSTQNEQAKGATPALISSLQDATPDEIRQSLSTDLTSDRFQLLSSDEQKQLTDLAKAADTTITALPQPLFTLPATVATVATTPKLNIVFALDGTGQLYSWNGSKLVAITQKQPIGQPVSLTVFSTNKIVASDAQNNVYLFDGSADQPINLPQPKGWANGERLVENYSGNLYILTLSDQTVHKIPGFGADITNDSVLTRTGLAATDQILSFLINGYAVTLSQSAGLVEHPRTGKGNILVPPDSKVTFSGAAFTGNGISISAGRLINNYDAKGTYQSSIALVSNNPISQVVNYGSNGLLVVINRNVYLIK